MSTLRCSHGRSTRLALALAGVFGSILAEHAAAASDPFALYAVPTAVELLPDDASATRVVVHGAFLFLTVPVKSSGAVYSEPKCGTMYFQCPAGEEELCRMQWIDLRNAIGGTFCAGFGTYNMLSTAVLRTEGAALNSADRWEMGMGVPMASYLGGQCPKALALKCVTPLPDGGPSDEPGSGSGGTSGAAGQGGDTGARGLGGAGGAADSGGRAALGGATGSGRLGGMGGVAGMAGSGVTGGDIGAGGLARARAASGTGGRTDGTGTGKTGSGGTTAPGGARAGGGCSLGGAPPSCEGLPGLIAAAATAAAAATRRRRAAASGATEVGCDGDRARRFRGGAGPCRGRDRQS